MEIPLNTLIENQEYWGNFESLIPKEEELTILGGAFLGREDVRKYQHHIFGLKNVYNVWNVLEEKDFKIEDNEYYSDCMCNYETGNPYIYFHQFVEIVKTLAQNKTDDEFQVICKKVKKFYDIRKVCESIYKEVHTDSDIERKEEQFFNRRYNNLVNSPRLETLSISQIKKFLTPPDIVNTDDIIDSATSLTKGLTSLLYTESKDTNRGIDLVFPLITKAINGLRKGQLIATGMFSNNGKTRFMIRNVANLVLKHNEKVLIISNEMTKDDIRYCFITTVINNPEFKEMFGIADITKNERDIRNGIYKDSSESDKITELVKILEEKFENNIFVLHTDIYSDEVLTEIILKHYMADDIDYFFYDTLKADKDNMANWDGLKATATVLSELAKNYNICIWSSIQLVDDSRYDTSPLDLGYRNIANSKQVYHILDTLLLFSPIDKENYKKYVYWASSQAPTRDTIKDLDINNIYYICRINKNRLGAKPDLLFKVNLDKNTWEEIGQVAYRERVKELLK